jgi:hypothetical protein
MNRSAVPGMTNPKVKELGMAEDQVGMRKDLLQQLAPWTKLFSAFKIALDPKKLLLAGAGILVMQFGWWILAIAYFGFGSNPPQWTPSDYPKGNPQREEAWKDFKRDRQRWNLKYEMAGTPPVKKDGDKEPAGVPYDKADKAESPDHYDDIEKAEGEIRFALGLVDEKIKKLQTGQQLFLEFGRKKDEQGKTKPIAISIDVINPEQKAQLMKDLDDGKWRVGDLKITGQGENTIIVLGPYEAKPLSEADRKEVEEAIKYKKEARTIDDIRAEARDGKRNLRLTNIVLELHNAQYKPYGRLRVMPWFEDRGPNPYLLVTGNYKSTAGGKARFVPWDSGEFATWLLSQELPMLLEPLVKFFLPLVYLFDPAGGIWNRLYLFAVILWSLATWALFGGAITRIASVQIARANERVSMADALRFAWVRYKSYFCAPLFPLLFLAFIVVVLIIFGFLLAWLFAVGDIIGGILWPLVLIAGLVMAVVLVGLVGWPMMYTTISAEGSDSFDAISRSYSYVYQAPWQYLWYSLVALAYGAVVIFFVGFMGSLMVYMSKWAVTLPPEPTIGREPSYLFQWAPTSFGWRDLLLSKSRNSEVRETVNERGVVVPQRSFKPVEKDNEPNWHNYVGTFLVTVWFYLLFLMVIGFSYSYFWTSSTIIYLLMRKKVDETELDEIHLEEEPEQPFPSPAVPSPSTAEAIKPNTTPVTMLESPTLRTSVAPGPSPPAAALAPTPPSGVPEPEKEKPPGDGSQPAGGTH